jgi:hypothetical protein
MSWLQHFIGIHSVIKYAGMFPPVANIQEAIALVNRYHIKAEIIGYWLYCFTTPLIGFQLEYIGFWYSFKHCAYIFTGKPKEGPANDETLDEIRDRLGCQEVNNVRP